MQLATATGNLPLCATRLWQLVSWLSSALNYKTTTKFSPFFWERDKRNLCWAKERTNWTWLELCVELNLACLILMDNAASKGIACLTELGGGGGNIVLKLTLSESNISLLSFLPLLSERNWTALNWTERSDDGTNSATAQKKKSSTGNEVKVSIFFPGDDSNRDKFCPVFQLVGGTTTLYKKKTKFSKNLSLCCVWEVCDELNKGILENIYNKVSCRYERNVK